MRKNIVAKVAHRAVSAGRAAAGLSAPVSVEVVHHMRGRLRLRAAVLKGDAAASTTAGRQLAPIAGVTSVAANPWTGSLLLKYDPKQLAPSDVIDVLARHGYVASPSSAGSRSNDRSADHLAQAIGRSITMALIERMATALIQAVV